jgi:bidirectional [NiFe] hydrogenase diaphorase subunit
MIDTVKTKLPDSLHASGDKRFKLLEVTMKRHQFQQQALIEVLLAAQELFGFLELDLLYFIARQRKLPPSNVYGVATFYNCFSLPPKGERSCVLCTGTACYVKGSDARLAAVERRSSIRAGGPTVDGERPAGFRPNLDSCEELR